MLSTSLTKYIKLIEWVLYFCLCIISAFFMWEVLDKFFSGKSSFTQSEEPIKESPTVTICLTKPELEFGKDFEIEYGQHGQDGKFLLFLKEHESSYVLKSEVILEKIATVYFGNCYKVTSKSDSFVKHYTSFTLYFNQSILNDDLPNLKVYFTSEKNSYGVVGNVWIDGKVKYSLINAGESKIIDLKSKQHNYLDSNTKCGHESMYECVSRVLIPKWEGSSGNKCSPVSLPSSLPICKDESKKMEFMINFYNVLSSNEGNCQKLCTTLGFSGEESQPEKLWLNNGSIIGFGYRFPTSSDTVTVYSEYLIYDTVSMIGAVGGTLGMCIGFSFTGLITCLINYIQYGVKIPTPKQTKRTTLKSTTQNHKDWFKEQEKINRKIFQELKTLKAMYYGSKR